MVNGKVEIGIAGCGWIAGHAHIPALLKNKNVIIKAVFDTCMENALQACKDFSIRNAFFEFQEFLECGLDAVIITSPNHTHVNYTLEAIAHKINVLCEKPVAVKEEEVRKIMQLAEKQGVIYVPGFVNRWRQDIKTMCEWIQSGRLGTIEQVDGGWLRKSGVPRPGSWFTNRDLAGGGVLADLGSHIIDICSMFLGMQKPVDFELITSRCYAQKTKHTGAAGWFQKDETCRYERNVEDSAIAHVTFEDHTSMNVNLSWMAPVCADYTYFKIKGSRGQAMLKTLFGFSNERLYKQDLLQFNIGGVLETVSFSSHENNTKCAFSEMLCYFTNAVIHNKTGFTNSLDALNTVAIIENLYKKEVVDEKACRSLLLSIS